MDSPGMAQYFSQGIMPQEALMSQYSTWHQERLYLLNALAEEENQGERLTQVLSSLQNELGRLETSDSSPKAKKLRQQIKSVRSKIGACQHRERALATNLANIVAQVEGMKRYQWRNAQQVYNMQIQQAQQHAQMILMSPARPQFALRSPGPADLVNQMQYMSLGHPPVNAGGQSSSLNPYTAMGQNTGAPQYVAPFLEYDQSQLLYSNASPALRDLQAFGSIANALHYDDNPVSPMSLPSPTPEWSARFARGWRQRATSLLVPTQYFSGASDASFLPVKPRNEGALRRLSLLDGTSAAMQLERKAAETRSKAAVGDN